MLAIERILVPIDFSAPSLQALDEAVEFSRPYDAELIVMFVVERTYYESPLLEPDSGAVFKHQTQAAEEKLEEICRDLGKRGVACRTLIRVRRRLPGDHRGGQKGQGEFDRHVNPRTDWLGAYSGRERCREGRTARPLPDLVAPHHWLKQGSAARRNDGLLG
jgi:Universal stress protein family